MRENHYLIGVDMGSTGMKAVALMDGHIAAQAGAQMTYHQDGIICEYDAEGYYDTVAGLIRQLVAALPAGAVCDGVANVCASGNAAFLKDGRPLMPIISWKDDRGGADIDTVFDNIPAEAVHRTVGWHKVPKFPLAQFSYLKLHRPEILDEADMICEGACYINYRLCGKFRMEHSTATTFYLQDQVKGRWNPDYLTPLGITEAQLPPIGKVGDVIGAVTARAARETGLPEGTPVIAGCYDGAGAARAAGLTGDDEMLISCGTSWVCAYPSHDRNTLLALDTMIDPYLTDEHLWIGMTSLGEAGVHVDRALDAILPQDSARGETFSRLSAQSVPGAHGLQINPMRLAQCGDLSLRSKEDVCRAVMEGIVYSVKRQMGILKALDKDGRLHIRRILMVGGPSNSQIWPQIVSDVMELPVRVICGSTASSVGAAMIAGVGAGVFPSYAEAQRQLQLERREYRPNPSAVEIYRPAFEAFQKKFPGRDVNMV